MASWTEIPNSSLESGAPIRAVDGVAFRDNPVAIAEGATGAPRINPSTAINWGVTTNTAAESDWVTDRTAAATAGEVGTYALCAVTANTDTDYSIGSTIAGSNLGYISFQWDSEGTSGGLAINGVPSGTWRCMGYSKNLYNSGSFYYKSATLWLRIA